MAVAMTNVAVPVGSGANNWTEIYEAAGTVTCNIYNRGNVELLVQADASAAATDGLDVAAEGLRPGERVAMALASGDKVFARPLRSDMGGGRVTVRV